MLTSLGKEWTDTRSFASTVPGTLGESTRGENLKSFPCNHKSKTLKRGLALVDEPYKVERETLKMKFPIISNYGVGPCQSDLDRSHRSMARAIRTLNVKSNRGRIIKKCFTAVHVFLGRRSWGQGGKGSGLESFDQYGVRSSLFGPLVQICKRLSIKRHQLSSVSQYSYSVSHCLIIIRNSASRPSMVNGASIAIGDFPRGLPAVEVSPRTYVTWEIESI